jgi:hypothetical protein
VHHLRRRHVAVLVLVVVHVHHVLRPGTNVIVFVNTLF